MQKLDRLGWTAGFTVRCYGRSIGVRTNVPELLNLLRARLPIGWQPRASPMVECLYSLRLGSPPRSGARQYSLLVGSLRLIRSANLEAILLDFADHVEFYVAEHARQRIFVHAGAVGWRGQAILIPGHSLSGKSTLVAALVRAGATYYSDEFAVLDARGRVHPYPRPLSLRAAPPAVAEKIPLEALGGRGARAPLPVGLVLITEYRAGSTWQPQLLSAGHGAIAMLPHTISVRQQPELTLTALEQVMTRATIWQGLRGEAATTAAAIIEALRGPAAQPPG